MESLDEFVENSYHCWYVGEQLDPFLMGLFELIIVAHFLCILNTIFKEILGAFVGQ
ncbi:MAG: hypothetical protein HRT88_06710 [Lentisphaeraceae bacterium]|nr:hypothetical protein [Lentisphaeraceae bacterium]